MKIKSLVVFVLLMGVYLSANAAKSAWVTSEVGVVTAFYLNKNLTGFVRFKACNECRVEFHKITPDIEANKNNKNIPLSNFVNSKLKPETLVFERATGKLVAINWFTADKS